MAKILSTRHVMKSKLLLLSLLVVSFSDSVSLRAGTASSNPASRSGVTLFVSKLGDNSDGSSWAKAFKTIQSALSAVPDGRGGHCIIVRPDTYMEANLFPAQKGAAGN